MTVIEHRAVRRIEAERRSTEVAGARAMAKVGRMAFRHAAAAERLGHDPVAAARQVIFGDDRLDLPGLAPVVAQMMRVAYLRGRRRSFLESRNALQLARGETQDQKQLKQEEAALLLLLLLDDSESASLKARTDAAAAQATSMAWSGIYRRLAAATAGSANLNSDVTPAPSVASRVRNIGDAFARSGAIPGHDYAMQTIAATAGVRAYEHGRFDGFQQPRVIPALWGWTYTAVLDDRTTPLCRGLDGTRLPADHPFWRQWTPPNHWGCRSTILPIWHDASAIEPPASIENYKRFTDFFMG